MAEQAQRRALDGRPQQEPPSNHHALEELRHLIIAPEQEQIAELRHRLDDEQRRTEDISSVVAEAIQLRRQQGDDRALADALAPTVEETLRDSVRKHPHVLADALFPVMGPAIRKSITETLRAMLESFNEALEHSLSWRGIQWRIEAMRTGKSFAEIVVMHSLVYRVEQVFLIHRETGLVLNHLTAPEAATQDPDMVSGMLSAIQQFARDGFNASSSESLDLFKVGELFVWAEDGPHAVVAAAIRGQAPESYRVHMREALESIEGRYVAALERFTGDAGPFRGAEDLLNPLFEARYHQAVESAGKRKPRTLITVSAVALLALLGWIGYSYYRVRQWTKFEQALRAEPGIVVTSVVKEGGRYYVYGFRDIRAQDPNDLLTKAGVAEKTEFRLAPFYSTDDVIVLKRIKLLLAPPPGVTLSMKDGVLHAQGAASPQWIARLRDRGAWIAGVKEVDESKLEDASLLALNTLKHSIESRVFVFPFGSASLEPGQDGKLAEAKTDIANLVDQAAALKENLQIEVVGHADDTGVEARNLPLSKLRADKMVVALVQPGVKPSTFRSHGVGTSEPLRDDKTEQGRQFNRSVTFRIDISPAAP